jgi:hypothetical protein
LTKETILLISKEEHPILESKYRQDACNANCVQVEGYNYVSQQPLIKDYFDWQGIETVYDRLKYVEDSNLDTTSLLTERGATLLRQEKLAGLNGLITTAVNCGQELFDVIEVKDNSAAMSGAKRRVAGIDLICRPCDGVYRQHLYLSAL